MITTHQKAKPPDPSAQEIELKLPSEAFNLFVNNILKRIIFGCVVSSIEGDSSTLPIVGDTLSAFPCFRLWHLVVNHFPHIGLPEPFAVVLCRLGDCAVFRSTTVEQVPVIDWMWFNQAMV